MKSKKHLENTQFKNEFKVIPISRLKDGVPVLVVDEMPTKALAEFHLATKVIIPIGSDWEIPSKTSTDGK